jgi:hypothetical protein
MTNIISRLNALERNTKGQDDDFELRPFNHEGFRLACLVRDDEIATLTPEQIAMRDDWRAYYAERDRHFGSVFNLDAVERIAHQGQGGTE